MSEQPPSLHERSVVALRADMQAGDKSDPDAEWCPCMNDESLTESVDAVLGVVRQAILEESAKRNGDPAGVYAEVFVQDVLALFDRRGGMAV